MKSSFWFLKLSFGLSIPINSGSGDKKDNFDNIQENLSHFLSYRTTQLIDAVLLQNTIE
jgi:hypothetical protein